MLASRNLPKDVFRHGSIYIILEIIIYSMCGTIRKRHRGRLMPGLLFAGRKMDIYGLSTDPQRLSNAC